MKEEYIIKKKLEASIMPYLLCTTQVKRSGNFMFYHVYDYTKEIFTLLAGYGISYPILQNSVDANNVPGQLSYLGIFLGVCVGVLRFAYGREAVTQRVIGQKKLIRNLSLLRTKMIQALSETSLPELIEIQKELATVVRNNVQEGIYSFEFCFDAKNMLLAKAETARLLNQFNINVEDKREEELDEETPDQIVNP